MAFVFVGRSRFLTFRARDSAQQGLEGRHATAHEGDVQFNDSMQHISFACDFASKYANVQPQQTVGCIPCKVCLVNRHDNFGLANEGCRDNAINSSQTIGACCECGDIDSQKSSSEYGGDG